MAMAPSHQPFSSLLQPAPPARRRGTCAASAAAAGRAPQLRGAAPSPAGGVFHFPAGRSCSSRKAQSLRCFAAPLRRSQRKQHAPAAAAADAGADDGAARGEGGSEGAHETHHRQQHHTATAVEEQSRPSSNGNGNGHARAHHDGAEGGNGNSSSSATAAAPAAPTRNTTTPRRRGRPAGGEHSKELKLAFDAKQELARSGTLEGVEHAGGAVGEGGGLAPSLARMEVFSDDLERAVNDQINIEFNMSYVYSAMGEFFDRDTVGLPGLAKYFRESSDEERGHAQQLMRLQNERGGRVHLQAILHPESEFDHEEKGDALHAMEVSLSFEKMNFIKLMKLRKIAQDAEDFQVANYVDGMLQEQAEDVKKRADYVAQLRRVGKGLGVFEWDRYIK